MSDSADGSEIYVGPGPVTHFKGGQYVVLGTAVHTESSERMVVYRPADGPPAEDLDFYARPVQMFVSTVEHDGRTVPRFTATPAAPEDMPDLLAVVEDMHNEGTLPTGRMHAVRALIDTQRSEAIRMLATRDPDLPPSIQADIRSAVAAMLRLLDAAEHEVTAAEQRRPEGEPT